MVQPKLEKSLALGFYWISIKFDVSPVAAESISNLLAII